MQIEEITPEILERALRGLRQAEEVPPALLGLHALGPAGPAAPAERALALHDYLRSLIERALKEARQAEGRPTAAPASRQEAVRGLAADFGPGNAALEAWSTLYHRYLAPVPLGMEEMAAAAGVASRHLRRRYNTGLDLLTTAVRRDEQNAHRRAHILPLRRHLPPPDYAQLVGVEPLRERLAALLTDPNGPHFVSVEGLGGIGKTALAQATAEALAEGGDFVGFCWISARQESLSDQGELRPVDDPAHSADEVLTHLARQIGHPEVAGLPMAERLAQLQDLMAATPYLVVVDNLETVVDTSALLPALHTLAGPTRFLLTSRHTLQQYPYVRVVKVPELSFDDSCALVHSEVQRRGRAATLGRPALEAIFAAVGGLPLALKLCAAQVGRLPLERIREGLRRAHGHAPERMYTYIYRRTWRLLDDPARQLLLTMLLVSPDGESADWLRLMSALPAEPFDAALAQLLDYSLLEVTGPLEEPVYRLHRVTATFLQTEVLQRWQQDEAGAP